MSFTALAGKFAAKKGVQQLAISGKSTQNRQSGPAAAPARPAPKQGLNL